MIWRPGVGPAQDHTLVLAPGLRVGEDIPGETSRMNRFFSKLDLRDIKIDPEGSRFPPDADEHEQEDSVAAVDIEVDSLASSQDAAIEQLPDSSLIEPLAWESPMYSGTAPLIDVEPATIYHPDVERESAPALLADDRIDRGVEGVIVGSDGEVLKVSARSRPSAVAGAIAGVVREVGRAEVQAIGAGATNQAVKAVAIARDYLRETGIDAVCLPAFIDVTIENEDRTAIRLVVEPR